MKENNINCSFCGLSQEKAEILIEGENAYICENCISKSYSVVNESKLEIDDWDLNKLKPHDIKKKLDQFIIGQDRVKKSVSFVPECVVLKPNIAV